MLGEAEIDIMEVAVYCLTNQGPYTCRYPLHATADITSPLVGYAELILQHSPSRDFVSPDLDRRTSAAVLASQSRLAGTDK